MKKILLQSGLLLTICITASFAGTLSVAAATVQGGDAYTSSVVLLLHMDGANNSTTFTDSSRFAHGITSSIGTTVNSTARFKFGTASALMVHGLSVNGSGSNFAFGTGDFTIEFWLRMSGGVGADQNLYDGRDSFAAVMPRLYKNVNEKLTYFTAGAVKITGTRNVSQNVWHHIAVSRVSGNTRIFLDGVQDGSTYTDTNSYVGATSKPVFGTDGAFGGGYITGNLDEVRVTKGIGRYVNSFTPPRLVAVKVPSNTGLVGYWSFNEGTTTRAEDYSGKGNHGTLTSMANPPTATSGWGNGKMGKGLNFDASNDYVNVNSSPTLAPDNITVSFWTKNSSAPKLFDGLMGKTNGLSWSTGWGFNYLSATQIKFHIEHYALNFAYATLNPLVWNHIVGTWDGTTIRIYVNGVEGTSDTYSGSITKTNPFEIGREGANQTEKASSIDEVRIYNRALSAAEIATLYSSSKLAVVEDIDPYFSFVTLLLNYNGADGATTITDSSRYRRTATVFGSMQLDTAQSKFGGSSGLGDGSGDYVTFAASTHWAMGTVPITVEFWIRFNSSTVQMPFQISSAGTGIYVTPSSGAISVVHNGGTIISGGTTPFNTGQWYHLAFSRTGTSWRFFRDGALYASATSASSFGLGGILYVGRTDSLAINGWIDDFRITLGVARYTADFTPPVRQFPTNR